MPVGFGPSGPRDKFDIAASSSLLLHVFTCHHHTVTADRPAETNSATSQQQSGHDLERLATVMCAVTPCRPGGVHCRGGRSATMPRSCCLAGTLSVLTIFSHMACPRNVCSIAMAQHEVELRRTMQYPLETYKARAALLVLATWKIKGRGVLLCAGVFGGWCVCMVMVGGVPTA